MCFGVQAHILFPLLPRGFLGVTCIVHVHIKYVYTNVCIRTILLLYSTTGTRRNHSKSHSESCQYRRCFNMPKVFELYRVWPKL